MMAPRHAATTCALVALLGCLSVSNAFTSPQSQIRASVVAPKNNLLFLGRPKSAANSSTRRPMTIWGNQLQKTSKATRQWVRGKQWMNQARRLAVTLCAALFLWVGAAGYSSPAAHAAPSFSTLPSIETVLPSASLDQMVDRYVKDHMFDDDVYDPVESAYRETHADVYTGTYPAALKDVTAGILGKDAVVVRREGENRIIAVFQKAAALMTKYIGVSEKAAQIVLSVGVFASMCISFVSVFGGVSFVLKNGMRREMKKRYGDDFSMDASDIKDPGSFSPEDDDDDGDDDGDDDDDDDDDDFDDDE